MEANELRIGNYATDSIQTGAITVFNNDACVLKHKSGIVKCRISDLSPVPITKEWLLKFGFKAWDNKETIYALERDIDEYNNTCFRFWFQSDKLIFDYIQNEVHPTESVFDDKNIIRLDIQHVHQLQNLYFALTNEELTFKSE